MPPGAHLAGVGAELTIATSDAPGEPSAAAWSRTAGSNHHAGDFSGELLPDGVDEPQGPVTDYELRWPFVGRGDQFQSAAGQFFRDSPGQVVLRQARVGFSP